jgi:hypothetical protein
MFFKASTNARISTEDATTKGADPENLRAKHHCASIDHGDASREAQKEGLNQMAALHDQLSTWHAGKAARK